MTSRHYAWLGLIAPLIFWLTYLIMSFIRPEYNFLTKAISELGSVDAPFKWMWNIFGYIIPGLFIAGYSIGLYKNVSSNSGSKLPLIGFLLSGLFMSFSGIFPGDFELKQSTTMILHSIGSLGSYVFFLVGAFAYPRQMKKSEFWKHSVKPTLIFTWLTILFGAWPFIFPEIPGVGQRVVFFFYLSWIFYTAIRLYKRSSP